MRSDGTTLKYYAFAGMMVAMDDGSGLKYFLTDHLGSVEAAAFCFSARQKSARNYTKHYDDAVKMDGIRKITYMNRNSVGHKHS